MKKITMMFAAVICCAMTAIVFSSCGDDESPAATDRTPVAAAMEYKMELGDQMLALFNMTIEYYDSDGTLKSEPMTQNTWTKKVRAKLPVTLGMRVRGQVKPGVDIDSQEKIFCSYGFEDLDKSMWFIENYIVKGAKIHRDDFIDDPTVKRYEFGNAKPSDLY